MKQHIVILTGAGISAESGLKTFRDANGLWEGHSVTDVASPQGFIDNPKLVLDFYNQRRRQLLNVKPNQAHKDLVSLQNRFKTTIITQNVDDLHERAGSTNVIHLHGELLKVRSTHKPVESLRWETDLVLGDLCDKGYQLRPDIVWFGEAVPLMDKAIQMCVSADILLIIGTSLQVYPAAGLMHYVSPTTPVFLIDPNPNIKSNSNITVIPQIATLGVKQFLSILDTKI